MIGDSLLHYRILSRLGEGGMGVVYLAEDTKLRRRVALKVLPEELASDRSRLERFRREAQSLAALDHPHIVTIHSVEEAEGVHFLTMGLVEGETLAERIPEEGLPAEELLAIAVPLADALAAAHARGIVHRDLKPANVMLSDDGRVRVLDFGLAKLRPEGAGVSEAEASRLATRTMPRDLTAAGALLGTVPYMSPEQVEGRPVDARTDLFSLGVMLWEMAVGRRPFTGETAAALTSSILRDDPSSVSEERPEMPERLARIVRRCLQKDPQRRYQSALDLRWDLEELAEDLRSGRAGGAVSREVVAATAPSTSRVGRPPRWLGGLVLGLLVGAVGLAVGTWLWGRSGGLSEGPDPVALQQLTTAPPQELFPSLSPDGQYVAYASPAAGNWDVYLLRIGGENAVNLTEGSLADDLQPAFSPDGQSIAFRSERDGGGLFVMGATGESVRRVADQGYNPDWSPDGSRLVHSTGEPIFGPYGRGSNSRLFVLDPATGESQLLLDRDAVQPRWSPHGHRIAYWSLEGAERQLSTVPAEGGEPVPVASSPHVDWSPAWSPDGRWLYFSSDRGGSMDLWRVPIDERTGEGRGQPEPLTFGAAGETWHASVARRGDAVVYATYELRSHIQRLALTPELRAAGSPSWVTQGSISVGAPSLSHDGWIAYRTATLFDLVISRLDGGDRLQITDDALRDGWPNWSPAGDRLAFYSDRGGSTQIWTVGRDGSGFEQVTWFDDREVIRPVWSPDGTRLAFSGGFEDDYRAYIVDLTRPWEEQEIVALPIPGSMTYFQAHDWSADGERLAGLYGDDRGGGVAVYSLEDRTCDIVAPGKGAITVVRWADDGRRVVWSEGSSILAVDLESGDTWEVWSAAPDRLRGLDVADDDRELVFDRTSERSDLWMLKLEEP